MKQEIGLWIDHRNAVIVTLVEDGEELKHISSDASESYNPADEAGGDRHLENQFNKYYDQVITHVREAGAILIIGPGEAKGELKKRLEGESLGERIVGVEAVDKMTDGQVAAAVREHFGK